MSKRPAFRELATFTFRAFALAAAMTSVSAPAHAERQTGATTRAPTQVAANFTVYVGGLLFVEGKFDARIRQDDYHLSTQMKTAGLAGRFYPADYKLMSEGSFAAEHVEPRRFYSDTKAENKARIMTMTYRKGHIPQLSATPPYNPDDLKDVKPALQLNTQDPVSAFLVPVSGTSNPCNRTIPVFDGKRRFNLKLAYQGTKKMTVPVSAEAPKPAKAVTAMVCTIRYEAIAPVEKKRRFTKMLRRNDDMRVWLAPFDDGRVYMPVRFELRTPIGSAVMQLQNLNERQVADLDPDNERSLAAKN